MVEVLVTIIVLSVGLLGLAALHATGLKNNQSAYWRSQATMLAYGIMDSMRSNRDAALEERYDVGIADAAPEGTTVAEVDVANWLNTLSTTLPVGDGAIDCAVATSVCKITVQWDDSMGEGGSNAQTFEVLTEL